MRFFFIFGLAVWGLSCLPTFAWATEGTDIEQEYKIAKENLSEAAQKDMTALEESFLKVTGYDAAAISIGGRVWFCEQADATFAEEIETKYKPVLNPWLKNLRIQRDVALEAARAKMTAVSHLPQVLMGRYFEHFLTTETQAYARSFLTLLTTMHQMGSASVSETCTELKREFERGLPKVTGVIIESRKDGKMTANPQFEPQ